MAEEETTLNDLSEKSSISATDILLMSEAAGDDYKIKYETLLAAVKSSLIGGSVAAEETKAPTGDTVNNALNSALTNYAKTSDLTCTDVTSAKFTVSDNVNLTDCRVYANSFLCNIQRLMVTLKETTTSAGYVSLGTISLLPKQTLRFTGYILNKNAVCEGFIVATTGVINVYLPSGTSGSITIDNVMYFNS